MREGDAAWIFAFHQKAESMEYILSVLKGKCESHMKRITHEGLEMAFIFALSLFISFDGIVNDKRNWIFSQ